MMKMKSVRLLDALHRAAQAVAVVEVDGDDGEFHGFE